MGKTRDLFKKIRDTKGTFHAKMGSERSARILSIGWLPGTPWLGDLRTRKLLKGKDMMSGMVVLK